MITSDEGRALVGKRVKIELAPAADEPGCIGRVVGKVESLDGLVLVVEPEGREGRRSYHYQHIVRADPA